MAAGTDQCLQIQILETPRAVERIYPIFTESFRNKGCISGTGVLLYYTKKYHAVHISMRRGGKPHGVFSCLYLDMRMMLWFFA